MLEGILSLARILVLGIALAFVIGYATPKFFIYLSITTCLFWLNAPLTPGFTRAEVEATIPRLLDIWLIFPTAIYGALGEKLVALDILGAIFTIIIGLIFLGPYLFGIFFGLTTWPELLLLRIIF